jgi:hypothetical protein
MFVSVFQYYLKSEALSMPCCLKSDGWGLEYKTFKDGGGCSLVPSWFLLRIGWQ